MTLRASECSVEFNKEELDIRGVSWPVADLRKRFALLSPREREIVIHAARGRLSKQIAHDIGIAEATAKVHRSRAMQIYIICNGRPSVR